MHEAKFSEVLLGLAGERVAQELERLLNFAQYWAAQVLQVAVMFAEIHVTDCWQCCQVCRRCQKDAALCFCARFQNSRSGKQRSVLSLWREPFYHVPNATDDRATKVAQAKTWSFCPTWTVLLTSGSADVRSITLASD